MANKNIKEVEGGEVTTLSDTDGVEIDTGSLSVWIQITNLVTQILKRINGLTADSSPDVTADYVATYDASAATAKKVLLNAIHTDANLTTSDVTTNDASTTKHGFLRKLSNVSTEFMNGQGNWATPAGGGSGATPHEPGGRLTLVTATPVMTTEQAAKTTIYYTRYKGDLVPMYNGSAWTETTFTELSLALDSDSGHTGYHQSGKLFDLFVYSDSGTLRLVSGPAWTNDTTRATALEYVNGILMNAASMTARFGSAAGNTVTVAQDRGTYVGTFYASANGTTTWELGGTAAGGDPGLLYLWNAYNRILVEIIVSDSTDSWTYTTANTFRSANSSNSNRVSFVRGLNEHAVDATYYANILPGAGTVGVSAIGLDSTSAKTGIATSGGTPGTASGLGMGQYAGLPGLGFHYVQALEAQNTTTSSTYYGDGGLTIFQGGLVFRGWF